MRKNLVLFAVACLVALPLAAASSVPVQHQAVAPAPVVSAQQAVAPVATPATATPLPLDLSPGTAAVFVGACNTDADCTSYCRERFGSPSGKCVDFKCDCTFIF